MILGMDRYTGEVIRIALVAGDEAAIRDKEFADCDIHGPGILYLGDGATLDGGTWDGPLDALLWEIPPGRSVVIGAIHVENSSFIGCRFTNVGIAAHAAAVPQIRAGFGQ
jgi:hypothetical protein